MITLHGSRALEVASALGIDVTARMSAQEASDRCIPDHQIQLDLSLPDEARHWETAQILSVIRQRHRGGAGVQIELRIEPNTGRN